MAGRDDVSYTGLPDHFDDNNSNTGTREFRDDVSYIDEPATDTAKRPTAPAKVYTTVIRSGEDLNPVQWRISLYTPISMLLLFFSGILVAIGHHLFYNRFNGTAVRSHEDGSSEYVSQTWIIRYGTAFAFIAKTFLAGAIVVSYKQHMWINLRRKPNSVATIDAVFAATHDFLAFLSPALLLRAKIPALLALVAWCLPLAALITPSTLLVVPSIRVNNTMLPVPTINFDHSLYRSLGIGDGSSPLLHRLTVATASGMEIVPMRTSIAPNTTYQLTFNGPSLKCEPATAKRFNNISAVYNETLKQTMKLADSALGSAEIKYLAFTLWEDEYGNTIHRNVTEFVSKCIYGGNFNSCGVSKGPVFWARMNNESITCTVRNTSYTVDFEAVDNIQTIKNVDFEVKELRTDDTALYMANSLVTFLRGVIGIFKGGGTGGGLFSANTMMIDTVLLELLQRSEETLRGTIPQEEWMKTEKRTFMEIIEELSRNQTLSLFSSETLWLPTANASLANVTQSTFYTVYEYRPRNLWLAYGIAIAFSLAGVILGLRALWINGVSHDNSFSSIMATTRNSFLDELTLGYSLGATPMPRDILATKLKFGELKDGPEKTRARAGFGLESSATPLLKGQIIY